MSKEDPTSTLKTIQSVRGGKAEKLSHYIKPMLASLHDGAFDDPEWIFEIKWDGYRAIAETGKDVKLYSRNGLSFLSLYPIIADELKKLKVAAVFDGEIVAFNQNNKPDFQTLQQYGYNRSVRLVYYVFDCLKVDGRSIEHLPLIERKRVARDLLPESIVILYSDHIVENGIACFNKAVEMDLEGIIAKRATSLYHEGKRTSEWLKIKNHNTQEAIIAGFTAPRKSRQYFGALILGIMQRGKLKYIGHTGTGFTQQVLKSLFEKLKPLIRSTSPFDGKIPVNGLVTWVEPELVCNIKFSEITADGILRHPVFTGLRIDKAPREANKLDKSIKQLHRKSRPAGKKTQAK